MDKILITSFKSEIANAILNMQDKLNPNKDAYIDKDEIPKVLEFFGVDDVSKLLKSSSDAQPSVFKSKDENDNTQTNEDTVEISNKKDKDDAINTYGTAAYELNTRVKTDLSIGTTGNPYAQQMDALAEEKSYKMAKGGDVIDTIEKMDALKNMVLDYMREHPDAEQQFLKQDIITYGKGNKALLSQTFGINGNNTFNNGSGESYKSDGTENTSVTNTDEKGNENGDESSKGSGSDDSGSSSSGSATVSYNIDFRTMNGEDKGNWHIKGTVNAGSDNSDIQAAIQYTKVFKNNSSLNFTGNLRETIEDKNNKGSYGGSIDYRLKKFSTGAYGLYYHIEVDGEKEKESCWEAHGKYGNTILASIGAENANNNFHYKYVKGQIQGKREFSNRNLTINGGLGAEYGKTNVENLEEIYSKTLKFRAKGGISFKSKDLSADVSVNATTGKTTAYSNGEAGASVRSTTVGLLGKIDTKHFNISTALSSIGISGTDDTLGNFIDSKTSVTASIIIGIKNIFGKNVMPIIKYNVGNYDGSAQNLGAGVIITP